MELIIAAIVGMFIIAGLAGMIGAGIALVIVGLAWSSKIINKLFKK